MTISNTLRTIDSQNVVAKLEGSDPTLKDEYVVYTAHWDHFGKDRGRRSSTARRTTRSACAALLEIARAFTKLPAPPRRSILFLAVTAEEQGLLGSQYYSVTPLYPLAKTVADINMDSLNVHGRTKDLTLVGFGASDLDDYARDAAGGAGTRGPRRRRAGEGVLLPLGSLQLREAGRAGARSRRAASTTSASRRTTARGARRVHEQRYHKPTRRRASPTGISSGAREDLKVFFAVGYRVAQADKIPGMEAGQRVQGQARRDAEAE